MKEQVTESTKLVVDLEDSLLCLHRERFFLRACVFASISVMTVVYRLLPARGIIIGVEMLVIVVLWIWAALNAKKTDQVYNEYVKNISPTNAQQFGLKPAPLRGFFFFLIKSWDVTCFFVPFLFFLSSILVSPSRNLDGCNAKDADLDKCIEANRVYRVTYMTDRAIDRLRAVEKYVIDAKSWVREKIEELKKNRANIKEENATAVNQDSSPQCCE